MNITRTTLKIFLVIVLTFFCGCSNMPLDKGTQLEVANGSLVLMSLKISNSYKPSYQPYVRTISITDLQKAKQLSQNSNILQTENATFEESVEEPPSAIVSIFPGKATEKKPNQYNRYLVSFQVSPGTYKISRVEGGSGIFPIIGNLNFPIDAYFNIPPNSTIYIGELDMDNQKRKDGERRSGSVIPVIDQAVTGFSGGTFKLQIHDRFDTDMVQFKAKYPALEKAEIIKAVATFSEAQLKP